MKEKQTTSSDRESKRRRLERITELAVDSIAGGYVSPPVPAKAGGQCRQYEDMIVNVKRLQPEQRRALDEHLSGCGHCVALFGAVSRAQALEDREESRRKHRHGAVRFPLRLSSVPTEGKGGRATAQGLDESYRLAALGQIRRRPFPELHEESDLRVAVTIDSAGKMWGSAERDGSPLRGARLRLMCIPIGYKKAQVIAEGITDDRGEIELGDPGELLRGRRGARFELEVTKTRKSKR